MKVDIHPQGFELAGAIMWNGADLSTFNPLTSLLQRLGFAHNSD